MQKTSTKQLKVYVAGKVSPNSSLGRSDWRDEFCRQLSDKSGFKIMNLDPLGTKEGFKLKEDDSLLIYGRNSYMIKSSDIVIVNLTDDISVGGSQEMLISKYYKKLLIGIAPMDKKFRKEEKVINGKSYKNWVDAYVSVVCDAIVEDLDEAAKFIKGYNSREKKINIKDIFVIQRAVQYYLKNFYKYDKFLHLKD